MIIDVDNTEYRLKVISLNTLSPKTVSSKTKLAPSTMVVNSRNNQINPSLLYETKDVEEMESAGTYFFDKPLLDKPLPDEQIPDTWIAYISLLNVPLDRLSDYDKAPKTHQQQQQIVRQLLRELLNILDIKDTCCYQQTYPYRLTETGYYICFSHTKNAYAVILSKHHSVGIDIEYGKVSWQVANRYFHKNELLILSKLTVDMKMTLCLQLWQIKECFIKINNQTLAAGMGVDLSFLIARLQNNIMASHSKPQYPYKLVLTKNDTLQLNSLTNNSIISGLSKSFHHILINSSEKVIAVF